MWPCDLDRILLELQPLEHLFDNQGQILLRDSYFIFNFFI